MIKVWIAGSNGQIGRALNDILGSIRDRSAEYGYG